MAWTPGRIRRRLRLYVGDVAWWVMTRSIRYWVNHHMDQWEKFKFRNSYGHDTYVTISHYDEYPDSFEDLDNSNGWPNP